MHNFVSWNPCARSQLISFSPNKLQLLEFCDDKTNNNRGIKELKAWDAFHVQSLDWRPCVDSQVIAYGTSGGTVNLVNVHSAEETSVSQGARLGKRSCNAVSWNKHMASQLLAGFDSLKSEFCAAVWDFEHEHFLHSSFGESACSVSWLPDNAHSFAVGTSMGWVKVYDTRTNSQVGAAFSVLAHPAPRPRKIRGIRPDPFRPHLFATYSDFPGDVVKIWDLRKVVNPASKQSVVPPSFVVVPLTDASSTSGSDSNSFSSQFASSMAGEAEAVVDVAWSTARAGVMAVATSVRRSVSFYSTFTVSGTSYVPLYSVGVPAPVQVNGLTWQSGAGATLTSLAEIAQPHFAAGGGGGTTPNSPLNADRKSIVASMTAQHASGGVTQACWESFKGDEELRGCGFGPVLRATGTALPAAASTSASAGGNGGSTAQSHPRLLVAVAVDSADGDAQVGGFAEVEVLDRVPLAISSAGGLLAVNTMRGRQVALSNCSVGRIPSKQFTISSSSSSSSSSECVALPAAAECYRFTDVSETMRQRCLTGYSADAYTNLEVLVEELDGVYGAAAGMSASEVALLAPAVANSKAVFRTWVWMDRLETAINEATLTVANCGILEVMVRNQLQHSASNMRQSSQWGSAKHPVLGTTVYSSEGRDTAKKLCGWIKMFGLGKLAPAEPPAGAISRSSSGSIIGKPPVGKRAEAEEPAAGGGAEDDLLELIVEELFSQDSFERAAAIALWHGRVDLAVNVLQRAIAHLEDWPRSQQQQQHQQQQPRQPHSPERGEASKARTRSGDLNEDGQQACNPRILWDAPYGAGYLQTVSLVAMCLAGYHYPALAAVDARPASPGKGARPASSAASTAASTWASMCRHVVAQLELSQREASGYLVAACRFLLANVGQSDMLCSGAHDNSSAAQMYSAILSDVRLNLEDRAAFACTFLGYDEAVSWLEDTVETCVANGSIEAVIITGLSESGLGVLQRYIDRFDDVQTAALLVSRVIDAKQAQGTSDSSAASASSKTSAPPSREWVWLHEYRSLLNKWEMFIERAYLDVELGKRYRRKAAMLAAQQTGSSSGKEKPGAQTGAAKRAGPKGMGGGGGSSQQQHQQSKSKAGRVLYRLPVHSDYPHFYLRCGFCGASLPVDGMQNVRPEQLRVQNNVLHCCAACSKQLPRCYVCQLYMGMVNPYLELMRVVTQKRLSADKLLQQQGNTLSGAPPRAGLGDEEDCAGAGWRPPHSIDPTATKAAEHNSISFGKWFFFCQHCRHGGHANCIDQWFGGTGNASSEPILCSPVSAKAATGSAIAPVKRVVCGVNGCDCKCVARL